MKYPHKAKSGGSPNGHAKERTTEPLDFNPGQRVTEALRARPTVEGITIDPPGTHIIDDGLSIRRHGEGWLIRTSVADLPAIIPHGSVLEQQARLQEKETYTRGKPIGRLWPVGFLDNHVSLRAGKTRPAITFSIFLDENLDVKKYKISRTAFLNQGEHHDGPFKSYDDFGLKQQKEWRTLAQALYMKRNRDLARIFDRAIDPQGTIKEFESLQYKGDMDGGRLMVHEVMRLTNRVATDYLRKQGTVVPYKDQSAHIITTHVSSNFEYDLECNRACDKLVQEITEQSLPYVHVNAPMRRYTDYLSLKILGQQLSGMAQDAESKQEVGKLAAKFNNLAKGHNDHMLKPAWRNQWQQYKQEQQGGHPLDYFYAPKGKADAAIELRELCKANGWQRPLTAERVIKVQNALIHFAGLKLKLANGSDVQVWAVSHDQDHAIRLASRRILQDLGTLAPAPAAPKP